MKVNISSTYLNFDTNHNPLIIFSENYCIAQFLKRHKRFSIEANLKGEKIWAHSNNSGSMLGLLRKGIPTLLSKSDNPKRKLPFTQEAVWMPSHWSANMSSQNFSHNYFNDFDYNGFWVGVNTSIPNKILEAAFHANLLPFTKGYTHIKREASRGKSRIDAYFSGEGKIPLWVECKNVTLVEDDIALFPDAQSTRGQKHLQELMDIVQSGQRAAMFYFVQRADGLCFAPADIIDPEYASLFWQAVDSGVEIYAMRGIIKNNGIYLGEEIPLIRR